MSASWRRQVALPVAACFILDPRDVGLIPKGFYLELISDAAKH